MQTTQEGNKETPFHRIIVVVFVCKTCIATLGSRVPKCLSGLQQMTGTLAMALGMADLLVADGKKYTVWWSLPRVSYQVLVLLLDTLCDHMTGFSSLPWLGWTAPSRNAWRTYFGYSHRLTIPAGHLLLQRFLFNSPNPRTISRSLQLLANTWPQPLLN